MTRDISFSVPLDEYARIEREASAAGFFGRCAVSNFARSALFAKARTPAVEPIIVRPTSASKRQWYADYAAVKGYPNIEAYALHAVDAMTKKIAFTAREEDEYARMLAARAGV